MRADGVKKRLFLYFLMKCPHWMNKRIGPDRLQSELWRHILLISSFKVSEPHPCLQWNKQQSRKNSLITNTLYARRRVLTCVSLLSHRFTKKMLDSGEILALEWRVSIAQISSILVRTDEFRWGTCSHSADWVRWQCALWFHRSRRVRSWSQRLGRGRCPPVQEVPSQRPYSDSDASLQSFPYVAREAVRGWADARAVPHVHPVQSHERGFAPSPGHAGLPRRDRGSPTQAGLQNPEQNRGLSALLRTHGHSNVKIVRCCHYC